MLAGQKLIVGVDAGNTVGIALLDLEGNLLALHSEKNAPFGRIIEFIEKHGTPLLVSTDVSPPPQTVQGVATKFDARLVDLGVDVRLGDKYKIVRKRKLFGLVKNRHELDALSAAIKAHRAFSSVIRKTTRHARENGLAGSEGEVVRKVLEGERIKTAIMLEKAP